jgi:hypothetical protein
VSNKKIADINKKHEDDKKILHTQLLSNQKEIEDMTKHLETEEKKYQLELDRQKDKHRNELANILLENKNINAITNK